MSYILDALKKSDQQRQRGVAPTLLTVQTAARAYHRPQFPLYGAIAAVLLCAGILLGWLRPWRSDGADSARQPVSPDPLAASSQFTVPARVPGPAQMARGLEQAPAARSSMASAQSVPSPTDTVEKRNAPALAQSEGADASAVSVAPQEAAMPSLDKNALAGPDDGAQGHRVVALNELPPSVQQELPNISISFHVYSNKPKDRRVMINGEMVGQGEQLAQGLTLEEITPDGVIFGYKGYRFRRGVH